MARDGDWPSPLIHPAAFDVLRRARQTVYNTPETFRVFGGFRGLSSKAGKQPNRAGRRGRRRFRGRAAKRLPGLILFGVRGNVFWGALQARYLTGIFTIFAGGEDQLAQDFSHLIGSPVKSTSPSGPPRKDARTRTQT